MCLNPVKIRNKSLVIGRNDWSLYEFTVPCNECSECKQMMRDQWYLRSYYQSLYTFDHGGYVLFDTLTYNDSNLPRLSRYIPEMENSVLDFPCFSFEDIRGFFKRLRSDLGRCGFDVKDNLKYFLCSEYGTDDSRTHRPHYHVLFFVTEPNLSPEDLSVAIDRNWGLGRTDGVPYRGLSYVVNRNVFGPRYNDDMPHTQAVCSYVMKYITKDSDFERRIKSRINIVMDRLVSSGFSGFDENVNWFDFPELRERYRTVKRLVSQFHRQSQHFGEYALQKCDLDDIMKTGAVSIPDSDQVVRHIPLPMYYSRKLFCTQVKDDAGRRYWVPSELGKRYKYRRTYAGAALLARRYTDWFNNLQYNYITPQDVFKLPSGESFSFSDVECHEACEALKTEVLRLLHGRSFLDLAVYSAFYRGRVIPQENLSDPVKPLPCDIVSSSLTHSPLASENVYRRFTYVDSFSNQEVDYMSLVPESQFREAVENRHRSFELKIISVPVFCKTMLINQSYLPEFENFDDIIELYEQSLKFPSMRKQSAFDKIERIQKVLKFFKKF